jgi:hypothetical protein
MGELAAPSIADGALKSASTFRVATARATQGLELRASGLKPFVGSTNGLEAF